MNPSLRSRPSAEAETLAPPRSRPALLTRSGQLRRVAVMDERRHPSGSSFFQPLPAAPARAHLSSADACAVSGCPPPPERLGGLHD